MAYTLCCVAKRIVKIMEIDSEYTREITCPNCGEEFTDSWEYDIDSGIIECYECDSKFHYERNIEVTYTTVKCE